MGTGGILRKLLGKALSGTAQPFYQREGERNCKVVSTDATGGAGAGQQAMGTCRRGPLSLLQHRQVKHTPAPVLTQHNTLRELNHLPSHILSPGWKNMRQPSDGASK